MVRFRRNSLRLEGYDYAEPNRYFVTICTNDRSSIFGEIVDGVMNLSHTGEIVLECWNSIPLHFPNVKVDRIQVMPNHVHGILEIRWKKRLAETKNIQLPENTEKQESCRDVACNVPTDNPSLLETTGFGNGQDSLYSSISPKPGSLSTIIRSFKSAVTKRVHQGGIIPRESVWQSRFYDRIIRSDREYFFIEQYLERNPMLWYLDPDNLTKRGISPDQVRKVLKEVHRFNEQEVDDHLQLAREYEHWSKNSISLRII